MTEDRQLIGTANNFSRRETRQYQEEMADLLRRVFTLPDQVSVDWRAMAHEAPFISTLMARKGRRPRMYEPAIDIAVGPFAIDQRLIAEYDELMLSSRAFLGRVIQCHMHNTQGAAGACPEAVLDGLREKNPNARCLLAVEIERGNPDLKYLIGSAVNACALGRIGIVVAWDEAKLQKLLRMERYLRFLTALEKNVFSPMNLVIVDRLQFQQTLTDSVDELAHSIAGATGRVS